MIGVIVSGHGNFASGICSALELILGKQEQLIVVDFPANDSATELEIKIKNAIDSLEECKEIIIFCDLLSGSPFNVSILKAMQDKRIKVIYGTNLGMLIESMMKRNLGEEKEEIIACAIKTGKEQIGIFTVDQQEEDEDEFD